MNTQGMALQRASEYRFSGYQVPEVPRACRSARGRGSFGRSSHNHSFDILASVAGKLLEKCDNSLHDGASIAKNQLYTCDDIVSKKEVDEEPLSNERPSEFGSSSENTSEEQMLNFEINQTSEDLSLLRKINCDENSNAFDDSPYFPGVTEEKVKGLLERKLDNEPTESRGRSIKDEILAEDLMKLEVKTPPLVGSGHDEENESFSKDCKNCCPFIDCIAKDLAPSRNDNASSLGAPMGTANRRTKKMSETKDWIGAPDVKDCAHPSIDEKVKEVYDDDDDDDDKRRCYAHEKSQKLYPFKKRKFFYEDALSTSTRGSNPEGAFISPDKRIDGKSYTSVSSSTMGVPQVGHNSNECNVKLSIKSFKVPELFIDIPTNETVGSLKRTVMEAVTSVLGDGLHVGILVQGKKVRDDNKTLFQTGISQDNKCHNLGFVLEPDHSQTAKSSCLKNEPLQSCSRSQGLTKHSAYLTSQEETSIVYLHPPKKNLSGFVESDLSAVPTTSSNSTNPEPKALVTVPTNGMVTLAVVPFHRKSGHHEYAQRRIRRPFSVPEVEALVRAVEKLGTGRWRDVKFHAFDNAKHRTYVDLKDKWKTLVHTARILPQQRRGEPVPQELLDRVLAAQAYWLHRQPKQRANLRSAGLPSMERTWKEQID